MQEAVRVLLSAPGVRVKEPAVDNMTALHFAAQNGHEEVCRLLITGGVPVNIKNKKGVTALHFACSKGAARAFSCLPAWHEPARVPLAVAPTAQLP